MNIKRRLLIAAVSGGVLAMTFPAHAVLPAGVCKQIAEVGNGVYDMSIKKGSSVADAERAAQATVIRRVHDESGKTIKNMQDAITECSGGEARASMCVWVKRYYTGLPC